MPADITAQGSFLPPGTRVGKYEIIRGVAVGGMAELYLARTAAIDVFDRLVALKRILPHYGSCDEFLSMFLDEARLTARIQHPNIAQVYDIGQTEAGLFFTMEFVCGEDARTVLRGAEMRRTRVPLEQALGIVSGACAGLHAAHEAIGQDGIPLGIVHRDVSPSNVIVSFDGYVKIIDFGIAKARGRQTETRDGTIKGKVAYMSPEQCRGEELDRRSDVFALGILLWELTTRRRLFYGSSDLAILKQIAYRDAPRPSSRVPDYPRQLEEIVMRALSRNLGRRYQTAEALRRDLAAYAEQNSLSLEPARLGKYMRQSFPESLASWQNVEAGVPDSQAPGLSALARPLGADQAPVYTPRVQRLGSGEVLESENGSAASLIPVLADSRLPSQMRRRSRNPYVIAAMLSVVATAVALLITSPERPRATSELEGANLDPPAVEPSVPQAPHALSAPKVVSDPEASPSRAPKQVRGQDAAPRLDASAGDQDKQDKRRHRSRKKLKQVDPVDRVDSNGSPEKRTEAWNPDSALPP